MLSMIAIGFVSGMVRLVDSLTLEDLTAQPFNNTNREAITHIAFSQNCEYFATAVCHTCSPDYIIYMYYITYHIIS